jgi:hypothetical protein
LKSSPYAGGNGSPALGEKTVGGGPSSVSGRGGSPSQLLSLIDDRADRARIRLGADRKRAQIVYQSEDRGKACGVLGQLACQSADCLQSPIRGNGRSTWLENWIHNVRAPEDRANG